MQFDFFYLFITDPVGLAAGEHYVDYEEREPAYSQSWLSAYNYAFQMPKDGKITPELLLGINEKAMSFQKKHPAGCYRDKPVFFQIVPNTFTDYVSGRDLDFSGSLKGISEFIDYWFLKTQLPMHYITFIQNEQRIKWLVSKVHHDQIKWTHQEKVGPFYHEWLDLKAHTEKITTLFGDAKYCCYIECMPEVDEKIIPVEIVRHLQRIIEEFEAEISTAKSADEKITVIAKHIQHIAQLHPFIDGNIRTCYILLNKLLRDYELPLTILLNPNRFDCCSLQEVVDMVKQGQLHYQQLMQHKEGKFVFKFEKEHAVEKNFAVSPVSLINVDSTTIENFLAIVINDIFPLISSVASSPYSLFAAKLTPSELLIQQLKRVDPSDKILAIISAVEAGAFNVAFRKACAEGDFSVISTIYRFQGLLNINLQEPCSEGKTPYDLLKANALLKKEDIEKLQYFSPTKASFVP
jgi:prophage maintenance system killer protein